MVKRFLSKYDGKKQEWLHMGVWLVLMLIAAFLILQIFFGVSTVSGNSMDPTFKNGQVIIFNRMAKKLSYGDVVSVSMPSGEKYIKRVVALPGDTVDVRDGKLYINGREEVGSYIVGKTEAENGSVVYPYLVEEGRYFVVGDNREVSIDSRTFGSVTLSQIMGKVITNR